ncbi:MAG: SRPBCC family protein [Deltaproteobacteria bacterium]|nr:SRPBCC family protein [Deltaproteobacteria bacterium]
MRIVEADIGRAVDACWHVFTDAATMTSWVPGLRSALPIAVRADGLAAAIEFAYAGGLSYALLYSYDVAARVVRWEPREPERGAVRGFARFEPIRPTLEAMHDALDQGTGTRLTYALEHDTGRRAAERALDDPQLLVDAFVRRMNEHRD